MIAWLQRAALGLVPTLMVLAACGGGSGSNGSGATTPVVPVSGSATPAATATPVATATGSIAAAGSVIDLDTNAAIAGASVTITSAAGMATTTSSASGAFAFSALPGALVAIAVNAPGYAASLQGYTVAAGAVRPVKLVAVTAEIAAWLTLVNADRAANGNATPLVLTNELTIAARAQALDEDRAGYTGHWNTAGQSASDQCILTAQIVCAQNGGAGFTSTAAVEAAFIGERANCPGGGATGCPYAENTGHFLNLVTSNGDVGLGASHLNANGYTQDFAIVPSAVTDPAVAGTGRAGQPISIAFRTVAAGTYFANWFWTTCPWTPFSGAALAATAPASPYAAGCVTTAPSITGTSLQRSLTDTALYTVTVTPPAAGTYSIGLASSSGWAALAVVNVPN